MKVWADFHPFILPDAPEAPNPTVDHALRQAAREFCERTLAWDVWLDPVKTLLAVREYDFDIASTEEVVKLLGATLDGRDFGVLSVNDLPAEWKEHPGSARGVFTQNRRSFWVVPAQSGQLAVRVALKPSNTGTGVSDELFAHYAEDIATGAKERLMRIPRQPFTDIALADGHKQTFDSRCDAIARQVEKSFSRTPRRTVARFF